MSTERKGSGNRKKKPVAEISVTTPPEAVPELTPEETTPEEASSQESIPAMVNDKNRGTPEE